MLEIGLNQNSSSFYPPSPGGATASMRHSSAATGSKPELKIGNFVEEDDSQPRLELRPPFRGEHEHRVLESQFPRDCRCSNALISVFLPWWGIYELVGSS